MHNGRIAAPVLPGMHKAYTILRAFFSSPPKKGVKTIGAISAWTSKHDSATKWQNFFGKTTIHPQFTDIRIILYQKFCQTEGADRSLNYLSIFNQFGGLHRVPSDLDCSLNTRVGPKPTAIRLLTGAHAAHSIEQFIYFLFIYISVYR